MAQKIQLRWPKPCTLITAELIVRHQHTWIEESEEALFRPPTAAMVLIRLAEEADRRREGEATAGQRSDATPVHVPDAPQNR